MQVDPRVAHWRKAFKAILGWLAAFFCVWILAIAVPYSADPGMSTSDRLHQTGKRNYGDFSPVDKLPYNTKYVYARIPDEKREGDD